MESAPINLTRASCLVPLATPSESVTMLPKSPTCLFSSSGAPWVLPKGLKWGPAEVQPLVLSPKVWMWKPLKALGSFPVISQEIIVGSASEACSKVTIPETFLSPLTTATKKVLVVPCYFIYYFFFSLSPIFFFREMYPGNLEKVWHLPCWTD